MVIDTSAILAVLQNEPESATFLARIAIAEFRLMSAATAVEASIVLLTRRSQAGLDLYRELVGDLTIETVPVQVSHVEMAVEAYARYGKGRHAAGLNFGDCFAYALARATDQPLLFKGDDFARTDVKVAA